MVTLVLIYAVIAGVAELRGYKNPLFGAIGIVLYIILQFPAAEMMPDSSEWTQCIVAAIASVVCMVGLILVLPTKDARAEPKESGVPYAAIGVVCLLAAIGVAIFWFYIMNQGRAHTIIMMGAFLLLTAALACFRLHKQQSLPSASEILQTDKRPPVLFLRSFESDAARVQPWGSGMLPMYPEWMGKSFEEFLAPSIGKIGPFIGLGDPEDYLPTLGTNKVYQRDDTWQETVIQFLEQAGLVLILEGDSPGLSWELGQVRQRCSPRSVFLITPTKKFPRVGWQEFVELLKEAGFQVPESDVGPGALVGFDETFQPIVLCQKLTSAEEYTNAIKDWHVPPQKAFTNLSPTRIDPMPASPRHTEEELPEPADEEEGLFVKVIGWLLGVGGFVAMWYFLNRR